jgi:hypothetical protein
MPFRHPGAGLQTYTIKSLTAIWPPTYMDASGNTHGFLYDAKALEYQSVNDPYGVDTTVVNGINNQGQIVGFYVDSLGNTDGLLAHIVRCEQ